MFLSRLFKRRSLPRVVKIEIVEYFANCYNLLMSKLNCQTFQFMAPWYQSGKKDKVRRRTIVLCELFHRDTGSKRFN